MSSLRDLLGLYVVAIVGCFAIIGLCMLCVLPFVQFGKTADMVVEGEVIAVVQSSLLWKHTTIHMKTYAEETITVTVEGYHEFQIHSSYRLTLSGSFWRFYRTLEGATLIE